MQHSVDHRTVPPALKRSAAWVAMALYLALPTGAQALGVGQLQVRSALNQPLNAEVELLEVRPGDLESLQVRIATQALGSIESPADVFNYRIDSQGGRHILRLTSSRPIREPLLNFLIELNWDRGRLLREVAIFLDPPAPPQREPTRVATAAPTPSAPPARPATPPAPRERPAAVPAPRATPVTVSMEGAIVYGPVQRGETLWAIAQRTRPSGNVDMQQMMQAIFQANPQAFGRSNMNTLLAGATLQIPAVEGQPPRPVMPPAPRTATPPPPPPAPRPQPQPEVRLEPEVVAQPSPPRPPAPVAEEVQVRLVPPSERPATAAATPTVPRLRREGEPFGLQIAGLDSMQQRVRTLQEQRPELLIARTEPEPLAPVVQPRAVDVVEPVRPAIPTPSPEPVTMTLAPVVMQPDTAETPPPVAVDVVEPPVVVESSAVTLVESEPAPQPVVIPDVPEPAEAVTAPDAIVLEPAPPPVVEPPARPQITLAPAPAEPVAPVSDMVMTETAPSSPATPSLFERVQQDPVAVLNDIRREPLTLAALGGGLIALLLLGWLIVRVKRRGEEEAGVYDEPVAEEAASAPQPKSVDVQDEGTGETRSQRLSRVDFLIAGGSYREAENVVRLIMLYEPNDPELQAKLLEIYYKSGDAEKFIETAESLQRQLGDDKDHPLWQDAVTMGNEMNPGHPLFNQPDDEDTLVFSPTTASPKDADDDATHIQPPPFTTTSTVDPDATTQIQPPGQSPPFTRDLSQEHPAHHLGPRLTFPGEKHVELDEDATRISPVGPASRSTPGFTLSPPGHLDETEPKPKPESEPESKPAPLSFSTPEPALTPSSASETERPATAKPELADEFAPISAPEFPPLQAEHKPSKSAAEPLPALSELEPLSFVGEQNQPQGLDDELAPPSTQEDDRFKDYFDSDFDLQPLSLDDTEDKDKERDLASMPRDQQDEDPFADLTLDEVSLDEQPGSDQEEAIEIKLDLAQAYLDMDDQAGAQALLDEVLRDGNSAQQERAKAILRSVS